MQWHPHPGPRGCTLPGVVEPHFQVEVSQGESRAVLRLSGELDVSSSPALEDEIERVNGVEVIILDLRELEFIDSTGLGVLVKTHQRMREAGRHLGIVEGTGQVKRLLELTGLDQQLTLLGAPDDLKG
jgi:anti-sigma B factor antagonist